MYGVLEKQFRLYFAKANSQKGITSQNLMDILESRLDNMVYRLGFGSSRKMARLMVRNKYFTVNGKLINIPSYQVKVNDVIKLVNKYEANGSVLSSMNLTKQRGVSEWVSFDETSKSGKLLRFPTIEELQLPINLQLIVELYSK